MWETICRWGAGTIEVVAGAAAGAAAGMLAGPMGVAIGAVSGDIVGVLAGYHVERYAHEEADHDRALDRIGEEPRDDRRIPYPTRSWA